MTRHKTIHRADIARLSRARVLCIGDVMLDRFVAGEVERVSPEAPIPVLRVTGETAMLGGAGNVARNLASLGAATDFISLAGDDDISREIAALLADEAALTPHLFTDAGRAGTLKTRYVCNKQQILRTDRESGDPVGAALSRMLLERAETVLPECGGLILSDYGKGLLPPAVLADLIAKGRAAGLPVIVDPKGGDYSIYAGADIITPNRAELSAASGLAVADDVSVVAAARRLIGDFGFRAVLATRGPQGMTLAQADDVPPIHLRAQARDVFDVSGAGDTVAATLAAGLAAGLNLETAAMLANLAAGLVVAKAGTAIVTPSELRAELRRIERPNDADKILSLDDLLERAETWRQDGLRIGFTNGCFDLLHPGHIALLRQARAACDRLIVGLNADQSVKRLKGAARPAQPESARADILAALSAVDAVVLFGEDTPLALIEAVRPDVLIKGKDYDLDQVVGADIVQGYGGHVLLADLQPGHSTSETLRKIAS